MKFAAIAFIASVAQAFDVNQDIEQLTKSFDNRFT